MPYLRAVCASITFSALLSGPVQAQTPSADLSSGKSNLRIGDSASASEPSERDESRRPAEDKWEFELSPYLWGASLRTDIDGDEASATSEACFLDLLGHLDFGAMMRFEGRHSSRFGFYLEGLYLRLSNDARAKVGPFKVRGIGVDATITQANVDFGGMYRFGDGPGVFDLMVGGRYTHLGAEIDIGPLPSREINSDFVAPAVGGRVRWQFDERWTLSVKADAAGFNVGDAPDITWGITGLIGYRLNDRIVLGIGYRYYDSSVETGDVDVSTEYHGPLVGMSWEF